MVCDGDVHLHTTESVAGADTCKNSPHMSVEKNRLSAGTEVSGTSSEDTPTVTAD